MERKYSVLVVENEDDHMRLIELFLKQAGIAAHTASTTAEADLVLSTNSIDAILLDIMLPGEDGISYLHRLRQEEKYKSLPILAVTAVTQGPKFEEIKQADFADIIRKPYEPADLVKRVKTALEIYLAK